MVPIEFGENTFDISVENRYIPMPILAELNKQRQSGKIDPALADEMARIVVKWAIERGAEYYTHWFVPYNGKSAEKHNPLVLSKSASKIIYGLTGETLFQSELDASSFPSGGIRSVFEARGIARWDMSSPMFIRDSTLYIPTGFISASNEVLDERTPLLRSMELLDKAACKVLTLLNKTDTHTVTPMVGIEQEFFVIDKERYRNRTDLFNCSRTLYGILPTKVTYGLSPYCTHIPKRVQSMLEEVQRELYLLGVPVETMHNEASVCQYEISVRYVGSNLACDFNQMLCSVLEEVAERKNLICIFHEKPFSPLNGSGKHNNWSLITDKGENLLSLSTNIEANQVHLFFIAAFIEAIWNGQGPIWGSAASYSNDLRLGGHEAPPQTISIYLGEELERTILEHRTMEYVLGEISALAQNMDADRNRTAPIAYNGNKFELRFPGAGQSARLLNTVLNTNVADRLFHFCDIIEQETSTDAALDIIFKEIRDRYAGILYNGNCYSEQWHMEAERRGLFHMHHALVGIGALAPEASNNCLIQYGIYQASELLALQNVKCEEYTRALLMEAETLISIIKEELAPSALKYLAENNKILGAFGEHPKLESWIMRNIAEIEAVILVLLEASEKLKESCNSPIDCESLQQRLVRAQRICNQLESILPNSYKKSPRYADILQSE